MRRPGLSTNELGQLLGLIRSEELIVILDCCHAGGVSAGLGQLQWSPSALSAIGADYKSFFVMAAANGYQEVIDSNGSFFTQALCDALEGLGVSPNAEGLVSAQRAFDHAFEDSRVKVKEFERTHRFRHAQDPVHAGPSGHLYLTRPARPRPGPAATRPDRNCVAMLEKVRKIWIECILKKNLYEQVRIHLNLSERPGSVFHRMDLLVQTRERDETPLSEDMTIVDVFDETDASRTRQSLLIQGKPGSGKTFLLLELLEELLDRAGRDTAHPIPVVFNLSSWAEERRPLHEWLAEELNRNYGVSNKLARTWVEENKILPLLDGLDEVKGECRPACVEAINRFRRERGLLPLVVCCRTADYDAIPTMLEEFGGSVIVRPLSRSQVLRYVDELKTAGAPIRRVLDDDPTLWELVDTPLMLYVVALTCGADSRRPFPGGGTLVERRDQLLASYVDTMLHRRAPEFSYKVKKTKKMITRRADERHDLRYPHDQTKRWLSSLAWQMKRHNQTIFYIERVQPDWLAAATRSVYRVVAAGGALLVACTVVVALVVWQGCKPFFTEWSVFVVAYGLLPLVYDLPERDRIVCVESVHWPWSAPLRFVKVFVVVVGGVMTATLLAVLTIGMLDGLTGWLAFGLRDWLVGQLFLRGWGYCRFLCGLFTTLGAASVRSIRKPFQTKAYTYQRGTHRSPA
jgi:hypothetical protein